MNLTNTTSHRACCSAGRTLNGLLSSPTITMRMATVTVCCSNHHKTAAIVFSQHLLNSDYNVSDTIRLCLIPLTDISFVWQSRPMPLSNVTRRIRAWGVLSRRSATPLFHLVDHPAELRYLSVRKSVLLGESQDQRNGVTFRQL